MTVSFEPLHNYHKATDLMTLYWSIYPARDFFLSRGIMMENIKDYEKLLSHHRLSNRKMVESDATFRYMTNVFFDKSVIVPSIHIGEPSRVNNKKGSNTIGKKNDST